MSQAVKLRYSQSHKKTRLILMDIFLDGQLDGIEAIETIKANDAGIPFIFISANTDQVLVDRAMKLKPVDYIEKPVQKALLLSRIETILNRKS